MCLYSLFFVEQIAKKAPEISPEGESFGVEVSSVTALPWRCCAAGQDDDFFGGPGG